MIYLNIGSNIPTEDGGREANILKAINFLKKLKLNMIKISSFYETPSYPNNSYPKFINLCVKLESNLKASELLNEIKKIEKKLGRIRIKKNEPRTCDIDIIDFNGKNLSINSNLQKIDIPHLNMHKRNFVLIPLYEINQKWIHPKFKKNIVKLLLELTNNDLTHIKFA